MKKNLFNLTTMLLFSGVLAITSCQKENGTDPVTETPEAATMKASQDDAQAEEQYDDVFNIAMGVKASDAGEEIGLGEGIGFHGNRTSSGDRTSAPDSNRCFTVTVSPRTPGVFPKTVTTDFGTGCRGRDGKLRKGKIVTVYTGPMFVPGKKATTTFVNYSVDSFKIEGTHEVENTSTSNHRSWTVKVTGGKITNTNTNAWKSWNSNKTIEQTEGNGTPHFPMDDVFKITGNASGSNSAGSSWTSAITDPLIKKFSCRWIVKGIVTTTRNGNTATLNYGNGACDNQAVLTINGVSHNITLR
jgi:hypothetical protein